MILLRFAAVKTQLEAVEEAVKKMLTPISWGKKQRSNVILGTGCA